MVGRKFTFWVVYDATGDRQFVKMDSDTGCLAMFDSEESAAAFASGLAGVDYKEVVLYSCSQPDAAQLVEALEKARDAIASLPKDALGNVPDTQQRQGWHIRDELINDISTALAAHRNGGDV